MQGIADDEWIFNNDDGFWAMQNKADNECFPGEIPTLTYAYMAPPFFKRINNFIGIV